MRPARRREGPSVEPMEHATARAERIGKQRPPKTLSKAVVGGSVSGVTRPKERASQNRAFMAAVRAIGRCMRCGWVPPPDSRGAIQFCHRDQGKGTGLKTDVRLGWAGCGPHDGLPGCHWIVGTSGQLEKSARRAEEDRLAELTQQELESLGLWPKGLAKLELSK